MWKSLGCGICWKLFCGFLVEDEGFNKWAWQCVWSHLTVELHPLLWCRRNAADANIISRYWSNMCSPYWSHSFCLHQAIAAGMSSQGLKWCWACFWSGIIDLVTSLIVLHPWHLSQSSYITLSVSSELRLSHVPHLPKSGPSLTGMWSLFILTLLTGDSLDKFLLENFFRSKNLATEFLWLTRGFRENQEYLEK